MNKSLACYNASGDYMDYHAIYHRPKSEYAYAYDKNTLHILLRTKKDDVNEVYLRFGDPFEWVKRDDNSQTWVYQDIVMTLRYQTSVYDFYFIEIHPTYHRTKYAFILKDENQTYTFGPQGIMLKNNQNQIDLTSFFNFPYIHSTDLHQTPSWVKNTIWYHIFPDRFYNDAAFVNTSWGKTPVSNHIHYGGNLLGIVEQLDYLNHLGINGIYLTPIFLSPSAHKYDTTDYYQIDPHFGTNEDFKNLVFKAHQKGIKIILDGVFNHCGFFHPHFQDVIKQGDLSQYKDWFYIDQFPIINFPLSDEGKPIHYQSIKLNYKTFSFQPSMPKWNISNPEVESYLLDIVSFWIKEYDIDGWRLDVSNELSHTFLRQLKQTVRSIKKDAYILGENWDQSSPWLLGDQLDGVMNYELSYMIWDLLSNRIDHQSFIDRLLLHHAQTPDNVMLSMFNVIGSHDTERIKNRLKNDSRRVKLAFLLMFLHQGTPVIYYGDEIGLSGDQDPDNRRCMPWDQTKLDHDMFLFMQKLIAIRKEYMEIILSDFNIIDSNMLVFTKKYNSKQLLIIINPYEDKKLELNPVYHGSYVNLFDEHKLMIHDTIKIESYQFYVLLKEEI